MEIIGKIAVKRNKRDRARKTWLTIGLFVFIITIVFEMILGNFAFLVLIVPFLYLLNLRSKMGKKVLYKDVAIAVKSSNNEKIIEVSNCEYRDKILYSVRFTILDGSEIYVSYAVKEEKIQIRCTAKKVLFHGNTILPVFENQTYSIDLYISLEDAKRLSDELKSTLNIER